MDLYYSVIIKNPGEENEHKVGIAICSTFDEGGEARLRGYWLPIFINEDFSGGWEDRIKSRIATFDIECACSFEEIDPEARKLTKPCEYHAKLMGEVWDPEDSDAIDSWMESRGDINAMMRRVERTILKRHVEEEK